MPGYVMIFIYEYLFFNIHRAQHRFWVQLFSNDLKAFSENYDTFFSSEKNRQIAVTCCSRTDFDSIDFGYNIFFL